MGPLPYVFVVIDYYSRFFEINVLKNTTADAIIGCLSQIFLTHGLPLTLKTDNGPQFVSQAFRDYMTQQGIIHNTSTPYWPQANGGVGRTGPFSKRLQIAQAEDKNWKPKLNHFRIMSCSTPHATTGRNPAELLFGQAIRMKLPELHDFSVDDTVVRDHDSEQKEKGKVYGDQR